MPRLFFGVSVGRSGTMMLANLLNSEAEVTCLHEGKVRNREMAGDQVLAYLTLENLTAYHNPHAAAEIIRRKRSDMASLAPSATHMGDIAYNYAPFVSVLPEQFPDARMLVLVRDGREFVRSAITAEDPDPTPVGWLARPPSTRVERFVSLGRLRPAPGTALAEEWASLSPVAKNAWLWSETNRIILDGLAAWPAENVLHLEFEALVADLARGYGEVRRFLGIDGPLGRETRRLLERPINQRAAKVLPPWREWDPQDREVFVRLASPMMQRLGYDIDQPPEREQ